MLVEEVGATVLGEILTLKRKVWRVLNFFQE